MVPFPLRRRAYPLRNMAYSAGALGAAYLKHYRSAKKSAAKAVKARRRPVSKSLKRNLGKASGKSSLNSRLRTLSKKVNSNLATYTKKYRAYSSVVSAATNSVAWQPQNFAGVTILEGVIAAAKYFDPTAPSSLVSANLTTGSYKKSVEFTKMYFSIVAKNNYVVPCYVDMYIYKPKGQTSVTPETCMTNSLADNSNVANTSPLIYPSDCYQLSDLWRIVKHQRFYLAPGAQKEMTFAHNKPFNYDPSLVDSESTSYQARYGGYVGEVRVSGVLAHDSSTAAVTHSKAGVDVAWTRIHTITYDAGIDTSYVEVDDNPGTITNTLQLTNADTQQETYAL